MFNATQLISIYLFTLVLTFILFNVIFNIKNCIYNYYKNLWWASIIASFVIALCFIQLEVPMTSTDDSLLMILIVFALFFPILVTIYLVWDYGQWHNRQQLLECDIC